MKKYLSMALLAGSLLLGGCGDSDNFVFTNTNNNVLAAPVCADDAYTTDQDTTLTVNAANGVLANDMPNGGTVTFAATSAQAGTITGNVDGSFTYTPPSSFAGDDSFTYRVANASGQSTCTVTITVEAVNGFFVDSVNGSDADGSFNGGIPFQTIQAAVAAAPTSADIVVLPGNYTGGINLKNGQRLLGSGSTLVSAQGATRPQLTGPVVLADGNTLDFLRIDGTNGNAVDADGQDGGIVTNCEIANTTAGVGVGSGVRGGDTQGVWIVDNNTFSNLTGNGVFFQTTESNLATYVISNNTATDNGLGGVALVCQGSAEASASVTHNLFRNNNQDTGDAFELVVEATANFCLDLENNINDADNNPNNTDNGIYLLSNSDTGSTLEIEEFSNLTDPQPGGAGNTGTVFVDMGAGFSAPTNVLDGACGF